jgi:hypothetical protein
MSGRLHTKDCANTQSLAPTNSRRISDMTSSTVYRGQFNTPPTISVLRKFSSDINAGLDLLVRQQFEKRQATNKQWAGHLYRRPSLNLALNFYGSFDFMIEGEKRSLTILFHDDTNVSISMDATGCAPDVMEALRPILLEFDFKYLRFTPNDDGEYQTILGAYQVDIEDLSL